MRAASFSAMAKSSTQPFLSHLWIGFVLLVCFAMTADADDDSDTEKVAHAAIGSTAWVFVFPVGAIVMRLAKSSKTWLVHASIQMLGLALITAGAGNGIYVALVTDQLNAYHAIIGLVVFSLAVIQATGGILAHVLFAKHQRRNIVGIAHSWLGRAIITLGMINGGLGLLLSSDGTTGDYIAYGVIAAVIWVAFVANAVFFELKAPKKDQQEARDGSREKKDQEAY